MKKILSLLLSTIFFTLAFIHFYWLLGGDWGYSSAIPTNEVGMPLLTPSNIDTLAVGVALSAFGIFYLSISEIFKLKFPCWIVKTANILVPLLFILRSVGEFKYIGFFKSVEHTNFGQIDTLFYSPLCLFIGFCGIIIKILK